MTATAELDAANAEIRRLESQTRTEAMRLARAYGVIGQLACQISDHYSHDFGFAEIEDGLEACRIEDDGRHFRVSTMGS